MTLHCPHPVLLRSHFIKLFDPPFIQTTSPVACHPVLGGWINSGHFHGIAYLLSRATSTAFFFPDRVSSFEEVILPIETCGFWLCALCVHCLSGIDSTCATGSDPRGSHWEGILCSEGANVPFRVFACFAYIPQVSDKTWTQSLLRMPFFARRRTMVCA